MALVRVFGSESRREDVIELRAGHFTRLYLQSFRLSYVVLIRLDIKTRFWKSFYYKLS